MAISIWTLITPAFVASVISIGISNRNEKLRAQREFLSKTYEAAREEVSAAVVAAGEYFPLTAAERTPALEAKLWMSDRELRFTLSPIVENDDNEPRPEIDNLREAFDDLIAQLTGGNFQSNAAEPDLRQVRRIASAGAELRSNLLKVRHAELQRSIREDLLSRIIAYWTRPLGLPDRR